MGRWAAGVVAVGLLTVGCSSSKDPDPGPPGAKTEVDGGEVGTGSSTTVTTGAETTGGDSGGATQGNQIAPGETTVVTSANNGGSSPAGPG
jgi:hypothetical protein